MKTWLAEFPAHFCVPHAVGHLVRDSILEDMSWRNDPCPSFGARLKDHNWVRLWVDHPNPAARRMWETRYTILVQPDPAVTFGLRIIGTDDLGLALWYLNETIRTKRRGWKFKISGKPA